MPLLLVLTMLAAGAVRGEPGASIDATIRGTTEPVEVQLLLRDAAENWKAIEQKSLPAKTRRVRFDGLQAGIYQVLLHGPTETEHLATKVVLGRTDARRITIDVEPFVLAGRVTLGGTEIGESRLLLRHREFHSEAPVFLKPDGTFRVPFWQRGSFSYNVRGPALPTDYAYMAELVGSSPGPLEIDIPDGRVRGILRDAKSGQPIAGAIVKLQTNIGDREEHVRLTTGPDGQLDFVGIKHGNHIVRISSPQHLEPEPIAFALTDAKPLREIDLNLDPGRSIPVIVISQEHEPIANAKVFVVSDSKVRARGTTNADGQANLSVPLGESATLFVVSSRGPFAMTRVPRNDESRRLEVYLPMWTSSLLIRAQTTEGKTMPPFSLLVRYDGELMPAEVAEELTDVQGLQLTTGADGEALLRNIPSGSYEFWPYRSKAEAEAIVAAGPGLAAPIQVNVRMGENKIAVKFASRGAGR